MIHFWNLGTQMAQPELRKEPIRISVWERAAFLNGLILGAKKKGVKLTATHPDAHPLRNFIPLTSKLTPAEIKAQYEANKLPPDVVADFTIKSTLRWTTSFFSSFMFGIPYMSSPPMRSARS